MQLNWIDEVVPELHEPLYNIYKCGWWTKDRSQNDVITAFKNSNIFIGACNEEGELIAFVRILSDFIFKAFIFDLIVRDDYRGAGVGEQLVARITSHKKLKEVQSFELYCPDQIASFYEKLDFEKSSSRLLKFQK